MNPLGHRHCTFAPSLIVIVALILSCPGVSFGQIKSYAFVPSTGAGPGNTVRVLDTTTHSNLGDITVGLGPRAVAITPDGRRAYVICPGDLPSRSSTS